MDNILGIYYFFYFSDKFDLKEVGQLGWHAFDCPFCDNNRHKKKHAVHFEYGRCKCWECGYDNFAITFIAQVENLSFIEAKELLFSYEGSDLNRVIYQTVNETLVNKLQSNKDTFNCLPEDFKHIDTGDSDLANRARRYMGGRMDLMQAIQLGIGYIDNIENKELFGYIIIPYIIKGRLEHYIGRDFLNIPDSKRPRYKFPPAGLFKLRKEEIFYKQDALDLFKEVWVMEGQFKSLVLTNAIAIGGKLVSKAQIELLLNAQVEHYIICLDGGVREAQDAKTLAFNLYMHKRVSILRLDDGKHPDDYTAEQLLKMQLEEIKYAYQLMY